MNRLACIAVASVLLAAVAPATAASKFDGTWKFDIASQQVSTKASVYLLTGGSYTCSTCVPVYTVAADGAFHPIAGNPYYDEVAVVVVDPRTIGWKSRKGGKPMVEFTRVVAADDATQTTTFTDMTAVNGVAVTGKSTDKRAAAGPVGSHAASGSWLDTTAAEVNDAAVLVTLHLDGEAMTFKTPTGVSYTTTIDGPQSPVVGDAGWTTVALKWTAPDTLVETDYRDGKATGVFTYAMAVDGRTIRADQQDLLHGTTSAVTLIKQ
ncbi:hypothetical protein [Polymorphobacter megasporae]|uniref:hypothetical protein n=1 Tax=Glacieibacterium megasporae TaxID=2835787 RepID=UPI001C1E1BA5|nr:hypothetical protein [Polymorphobacter megasporae]UAJ11766.1 hypothetical protein KTC28_08950 [Polymorphobacter megasporae]